MGAFIRKNSMTDPQQMRDKKERDLRDQIERAGRVGWPILAIVGIVVVIVLAAVAFVTLSACTTLTQEPLTLRQQIYRLDISACYRAARI